MFFKWGVPGKFFESWYEFRGRRNVSFLDVRCCSVTCSPTLAFFTPVEFAALFGTFMWLVHTRGCCFPHSVPVTAWIVTLGLVISAAELRIVSHLIHPTFTLQFGTGCFVVSYFATMMAFVALGRWGGGIRDIAWIRALANPWILFDDWGTKFATGGAPDRCLS
jgi:hypothetical protein